MPAARAVPTKGRVGVAALVVTPVPVLVVVVVLPGAYLVLVEGPV